MYHKEHLILYSHLIYHHLTSYMSTAAMMCFIYLPNLGKKVKWTMK